MNPMMLLQFKNSKEQFCRNHPKFPLFLKTVSKHALKEGTIIEFQVTTPEGKNLSSNLRLTTSDIEAIRQMKETL